MKIKYFIVAVPVLFFLRPAMAQVETESEDVLAVVQTFFDAMNAADSVASSSVLLAQGHLYATVLGESDVVVRHTLFSEYLASISKGSNVYLERMWNPEVTIKQWLASVTTPYDFHIDGKFSHCGTDIFNLVKIQGAWKIASAIYTVERSDCPPSPLGDPE